MASDATRVLVLVKASPQPSKQYGDTVCVAGLDIDARTPRWLRLYPVPFRYVDGSALFKKYDIIGVRTRAAGSDKRPESRKIDASAIQVERHVPTWSDREAWLARLETPSMCEIYEQVRLNLNSCSLAAIRPAVVQKPEFTDHPGWSPEELARFEAYRNQGDLFREHPPRLLDPPKLIVHLSYRCVETGCEGHRQRIMDWELTALQHRLRNRPRGELERAVTRNFFDVPFAPDRAPLIFVGNQENVQRRASFTVLGIYYPRRSDVRQKDVLF